MKSFADDYVTDYDVTWRFSQCKQYNSGATAIGGFTSASGLPLFYSVHLLLLCILGNNALVMRILEVGHVPMQSGFGKRCKRLHINEYHREHVYV